MDPETARKKSNAHKHVKKIKREEGGGQYVDRLIERLYDQGITVKRNNRNDYRFRHPDAGQRLVTTSFTAGHRLFDKLDDVSTYLDGPRTSSNIRRNYRAVEDILRKQRNRYPKSPKRDSSKARKKSNVDNHIRSIQREEGITSVERGIDQLYDDGVSVKRKNRNDYRFNHPDTKETIISRSFGNGLYLFDALDDVYDILESPRSRSDVRDNYRGVEKMLEQRRRRA